MFRHHGMHIMFGVHAAMQHDNMHIMVHGMYVHVMQHMSLYIACIHGMHACITGMCALYV